MSEFRIYLSDFIYFKQSNKCTSHDMVGWLSILAYLKCSYILLYNIYILHF